MGKASKWFRALLGLKKPDTTSSAPKPSKEKRRWSFVKSYREKDNHHTATAKLTVDNTRVTTYGDVPVQSADHEDDVDPDKQSTAVAAATAAEAAATAAEAAVAAAQAAGAVVRLTNSGRCAGPTAGALPYVAGGTGIREKWAAVKIQAAYRGCLARRALRALKGLVKLQALVRGHIERKRTAEWLQRMQALLRAQGRARAGRSQIMQTSYSSAKSSNLHLPGPATPDKFESPVRSKSMKYDQSSVLKKSGSKSHVQFNSSRSDNRLDEQLWTQPRSSSRTFCGDDEKSFKTLEIDSGKSHFAAKRRSLFHSTHHASVSDQYGQSLTISKDSTTRQSGQSPSSCEVQSYSRQVIDEVEESPFCTANNSPQFYSASSRDGSKTSTFTPARSDGSRSYRSGYSYCPNYMAYTESSKAKVRSLSAPKQRPHYERSSSSNRYSVHGFVESRSTTQRKSALHASFTSKAYPGSGRLDKLGMPLGYRY